MTKFFKGLAITLLLLLLATLWLAGSLWHGVFDGGWAPMPSFDIDINGHHLTAELREAFHQLQLLPLLGKLLLVGALAVLGLVLLVMLPLAVLVAVGGIIAVVLAALGLKLLLVLMVLALVFSPLWLGLLLLWWLIRPRRPAAPRTEPAFHR